MCDRTKEFIACVVLKDAMKKQKRLQKSPVYYLGVPQQKQYLLTLVSVRISPISTRAKLSDYVELHVSSGV